MNEAAEVGAVPVLTILVSPVEAVPAVLPLELESASLQKTKFGVAEND
jgi:hypothetical protein